MVMGDACFCICGPGPGPALPHLLLRTVRDIHIQKSSSSSYIFSSSRLVNVSVDITFKTSSCSPTRRPSSWVTNARAHLQINIHHRSLFPLPKCVSSDVICDLENRTEPPLSSLHRLSPLIISRDLPIHHFFPFFFPSLSFPFAELVLSSPLIILSPSNIAL